MRALFAVLLVFLAIACVAGCSGDRGVAPAKSDTSNGPGVNVDPDVLAAELVAQSGWTVAADEEIPAKLQNIDRAAAAGQILGVTRQPLLNGIVHYSFKVRVGRGPYDVIGLHRVVKESRPYCPIKTKKNIFLQHGDGVGFVKFLFGFESPSTPDDQSFAIFLARNGVDVWGIDHGWILVPMETTDFSFMAGWGMQREIDDLRIGLAVARASRLLTGSGCGKMNLLGYSSGVFTGYAYLNAETQFPESARNVGGFIAADCPYKDNDESNRAGACATAASLKSLIDSGTYVDTASGYLFLLMGQLARTDPDGESPVVPGATNRQAVLYLGAATHLFAPFPPFWHYWAGTFDESGVPTGLQYTTYDGMLDFLAIASPYEPLGFEYDVYSIWCDELDVPFDDHLANITVPVFYVGAAGGLGVTGLYATTLLGSSDVSSLIVKLHPDDEIALDFGHIDLFTAGNAQALAWTPILGWIQNHTAYAPGPMITMD
jgi:hypothetical protein